MIICSHVSIFFWRLDYFDEKFGVLERSRDLPSRVDFACALLREILLKLNIAESSELREKVGFRKPVIENIILV